LLVGFLEEHFLHSSCETLHFTITPARNGCSLVASTKPPIPSCRQGKAGAQTSTNVGTDLNSRATFVKKKVPAEPAVSFASQERKHARKGKSPIGQNLPRWSLDPTPETPEILSGMEPPRHIADTSCLAA
jgi:hypothetical protein